VFLVRQVLLHVLVEREAGSQFLAGVEGGTISSMTTSLAIR